MRRASGACPGCRAQPRNRRLRNCQTGGMTHGGASHLLCLVRLPPRPGRMGTQRTRLLSGRQPGWFDYPGLTNHCLRRPLAAPIASHPGYPQGNRWPTGRQPERYLSFKMPFWLPTDWLPGGPGVAWGWLRAGLCPAYAAIFRLEGRRTICRAGARARVGRLAGV
jgi:hypothetical protein